MLGLKGKWILVVILDSYKLWNSARAVKPAATLKWEEVGVVLFTPCWPSLLYPRRDMYAPLFFSIARWWNKSGDDFFTQSSLCMMRSEMEMRHVWSLQCVHLQPGNGCFLWRGAFINLEVKTELSHAPQGYSNDASTLLLSVFVVLDLGALTVSLCRWMESANLH